MTAAVWPAIFPGQQENGGSPLARETGVWPRRRKALVGQARAWDSDGTRRRLTPRPSPPRHCRSSRGTRKTVQISAEGAGRPYRGLRRPTSGMLLRLAREAPSVDKVRGQLQPPHEVADLGTRHRDLRFSGLPAVVEAEHRVPGRQALPGFPLVCRDQALPRGCGQSFAPRRAEEQIRLPRRARTTLGLAFRSVGKTTVRRSSPRSLLAHDRPPGSAAFTRS